MKIAFPPLTSNTEGNLTKQMEVFNLVAAPGDEILYGGMDYKDLDSVHSAKYVAGVHSGLITNGFADRDYRKVLHAEASVAAMIAATDAAITGGKDLKRVAFAPVSGFHHAGWDHGGGYCTFNGLMLAAVHAHNTHKCQKILILDGDGHFGDGTKEIIEELNVKSQVLNWWIGRDATTTWMDKLDDQLKRGVDLILYQAGADAHIDDPYGAGTLTTADWVKRDRTIFHAAKKHVIPIVWNLAGGYNGAKTLDLHTSTFETAEMVYYDGARSIRRAGPDRPSAFQADL